MGNNDEMRPRQIMGKWLKIVRADDSIAIKLTISRKYRN